MTVDADAIEAAGDRLRSVVRRTPLDGSDRLSATLGVPVLLKREDMQVCRSYKVRGAYNLISSLTDDERHRGVVCASAGNHGQGLAFCCAALHIHGKVFLPASTPRQKRERIRAIGGQWVEPIIAGSTFDETNAAAEDDADRRGAVYVHPFDDPRIIAGQGTVAVETAGQLADYAGSGLAESGLAESGLAASGLTQSGLTVVVPVGGGGLIAGMAVWLKARHPQVRIVGAEPAGAASMAAALAAGKPVDLDHMDTFVDGAAVGRVGHLTFPVVRDLVDDMVGVPEGAVCTEMLDLYQSDGIIAEPAGALASAAARQYLRGAGGPVVCVVSGGNNDVSRYAEVVERSLLHEGLRHYFLITFPQEPGALRSFLDSVLTHGEDIVVFEYVKKNNRETGPALVGVDLERAADYDDLIRRMEDSPLHIEQVPPGSPLFSFLL